MNKKTLGLQIAAAVGMFAIAAVPAFAQLNLGASVSTSASASSKMADKQDKGDAMIDARIQALTDLDTRVNAMTKVSSSDKSALDSNISAQISAMNALKAKLGSDTTAASIKADKDSITSAYRIYMLVLPQGRILAASDRALDIGTSFATLSAKLQADIATASAGGHDVTALNASLSDLNAKVSDSNTKASAAVTLTAGLQPDNGNATIEASNKTALASARADITAANSDLKAAYADAKSIVQALHGFGVIANASVSNQ